MDFPHYKSPKPSLTTCKVCSEEPITWLSRRFGHSLEAKVSKNHEKKKRRTLTGRRAWLAMGTIAAYAAAGSSKATLAFAKSPKGHANGQAKLPVRRFDIPAGPLTLRLPSSQGSAA